MQHPQAGRTSEAVGLRLRAVLLGLLLLGLLVLGLFAVAVAWAAAGPAAGTVALLLLLLLLLGQLLVRKPPLPVWVSRCAHAASCSGPCRGCACTATKHINRGEHTWDRHQKGCVCVAVAAAVAGAVADQTFSEAKFARQMRTHTLPTTGAHSDLRPTSKPMLPE